ncbi:MAG: DUF4249 domain-containing protein [Lunatimonas sp.]|uniref:DUF4249 family protein n=1 Tax=Lunatimonas sp. TaxID=2060141 RepID=UPI00263AEFB3|nr:DUF4249 family protein [Lunatimonas sp.]MCC5937960.1 DUF4249 domain-containing protein [Lunatimonas sp.]
MKNFFFLFGLVALFSCQEEVYLDLRNQERVPVIEAFWTDNPALNRVKISYSRDYYDTASNELEKEAMVTITNLSTGEEIPFGFSEDFQRYLPRRYFSGRRGDMYRLEVLLGDQVYESEGMLLEPPVLDSIVYQFREERLFSEEGYYLTVYGKIPFDTDNYYRVRITRNDTLLSGRQDYLLFDDTFGTSILDNGFELGGFAFKAGDKVKLELFRLNRSAYNYLNDLVNLLFNDGGLFSPPPQNPRSNIRLVQGTGRVEGYFVVAPVLTETLTIPLE